MPTHDDCAPPALEPARDRARPPALWAWSCPNLKIDFTALPPLPAIGSPELAKQALSSKDYIGTLAGRIRGFTYDDELRSYRRLEWLGDSILHPAYSTRLYSRFPEAAPHTLSVRNSVIPRRCFKLSADACIPAEYSQRAHVQHHALAPCLDL